MFNTLTLKCKVTSKSVTYTDPVYIQKRITAAGGIEELVANFVSREGKKIQKGGSLSPTQVPVPTSETEAASETPVDPKDPSRSTEGERVTTRYTYKDGTHCTVTLPKGFYDKPVNGVTMKIPPSKSWKGR